jgi:hypothetical protein
MTNNGNGNGNGHAFTLNQSIGDLVNEAVHLEPHALSVLVHIACRMREGRRAYGDLDITTDTRNWRGEAQDELSDGLVCLAIANLKEREAESHRDAERLSQRLHLDSYPPPPDPPASDNTATGSDDDITQAYSFCSKEGES